MALSAASMLALRAIDAYSAGVRYGTEEFKQNVYNSHRQVEDRSKVVKNQSGGKLKKIKIKIKIKMSLHPALKFPQPYSCLKGDPLVCRRKLCHTSTLKRVPHTPTIIPNATIIAR